MKNAPFSGHDVDDDLEEHERRGEACLSGA